MKGNKVQEERKEEEEKKKGPLHEVQANKSKRWTGISSWFFLFFRVCSGSLAQPKKACIHINIYILLLLLLLPLLYIYILYIKLYINIPPLAWFEPVRFSFLFLFDTRSHGRSTYSNSFCVCVCVLLLFCFPFGGFSLSLARWQKGNITITYYYCYMYIFIGLCRCVLVSPFKKKKNWRKTALSLCRKKKWFHTQTHNKRLRAVCGCIIHPLFHLSSFVFSLLHRKCHSLPLSIVCQIWTRATKEEGKKWKIIYTYKYT